MKQLFTYLSLFLSSIGFAQTSLPIENNSLPTDTLRILMIGNSFTDDVTEYIGEIVKNLGVDEKTCCLYRVTQGGSSLQTWRDKYKNNAIVSLERKAGELTMPVVKGTLQSILQQNWDVISLQQLSNCSNDILSYSPYLDELISYIKTDCTNKSVALCWHLTWSYWNEHSASGPKEYAGWSSIVSTVDRMVDTYGIDIIIPSGTAIQIARSTELNTEKSLTRDGYHMDYGIGRYIIACTLFETLFAPIYGVSVTNLSWFPQNVTTQMATIAHDCAKNAIENWHEAPCTRINGIDEDGISLFPNPTNDSIIIAYNSNTEDVAYCSFFSVSGEHVFDCEIFANQKNVVDLKNLEQGIYFVSIQCGEELYTKRIEKK